ncbi:MAG: hypothetical protein ACTS7I_02650, partial [Candidatus Hodgkinia cicadicola]
WSNCSSEYEKDRVKERMVRLSSGVAVIKVGGMTEVEAKERHYNNYEKEETMVSHSQDEQSGTHLESLWHQSRGKAVPRERKVLTAKRERERELYR